MVPPISATSENPDAHSAYQSAQQHYERGDLTVAATQFSQFTADYPQDALLPAAQIQQGRIALEQGDPARAFEVLSALHLPDGDPLRHHLALYLGRAQFELGQYAAAFQRLEPYAGRFSDPQEHRLLLQTLWRASQHLDDLPAIIRFSEQYLLALPDGESAARREIYTDIQTRLLPLQDPSQLERLLAELQGHGWPWGFLMAQSLQLHMRHANINAAADIAAALQEHCAAAPECQQPEWALIRNALAAFAHQMRADMHTIGLLLPLTGRMQLLGDAAAKGAQAAILHHARTQRGKPLRLVIKDTAGDPQRAVAALQELAEVDKAGIVIGPLDAAVSAAAEQRAAEIGIPLITLTSREGAVRGPAWSFRQTTAATQEVTALLDAVPESAGMRLAVLYPDASYGRLMLRAAQDAAQQRGLHIAAALAVDAKQTDFSAVARDLAKNDFELLLLPMTAAQLALAAPALAAAGIWPNTTPPAGVSRPPTTWLVPSVGHSQALVQRAGRYLQDALFVSLFAPEANPIAREFSLVYRDQYRSEPTSFAANAHDAVTIAAFYIAQGAADRLDLRARLQQAADAPAPAAHTCTPFRGFGEDGQPLAVPQVFRLRGNPPTFDIP